MNEKLNIAVTPCHCGALCYFDGTECFGKVGAVGDTTFDIEWGSDWVHACENEEHRDKVPTDW